MRDVEEMQTMCNERPFKPIIGLFKIWNSGIQYVVGGVLIRSEEVVEVIVYVVMNLGWILKPLTNIIFEDDDFVLLSPKDCT